MTTPLIPSLLHDHQLMLSTVHDLRLALLEGRISIARQALLALQTLHATHIAAEEAQWIPQLTATARWHPRVYLAEHAKLGELIQQWRQRLDDLGDLVDDAQRRPALLDSSLTLQRLLEHHFEREEKGLFEEVER